MNSIHNTSKKNCLSSFYIKLHNKWLPKYSTTKITTTARLVTSENKRQGLWFILHDIHRRHCERHRRKLLKTACFYHLSYIYYSLLCPPPPSPFREGEAPVRPIICVTILECGKIKIQQFNNRLGSLIKFPKF